MKALTSSPYTLKMRKTSRKPVEKRAFYTSYIETPANEHLDMISQLKEKDLILFHNRGPTPSLELVIKVEDNNFDTIWRKFTPVTPHHSILSRIISDDIMYGSYSVSPKGIISVKYQRVQLKNSPNYDLNSEKLRRVGL